MAEKDADAEADSVAVLRVRPLGRFGYAVAIASGHGAGGAPWTDVGGLSRAVRVWPLAPK